MDGKSKISKLPNSEENAKEKSNDMLSSDQLYHICIESYTTKEM